MAIPAKLRGALEASRMNQEKSSEVRAEIAWWGRGIYFQLPVWRCHSSTTRSA